MMPGRRQQAHRDRSDRLRRAVQSLRDRGALAGHIDAGSIHPLNIHAAITRQMVEDLGEDVDELKGEIRRLVFVIVGAVVLLLVERLMAGVS